MLKTFISSAIITFGLNALYGRYNVRRSFWAGKWNSTNAYNFVKYTISKGYPVDSWEYGNLLYYFFYTWSFNIAYHLFGVLEHEVS